jgi:cytochrome P450
MMQVLTQALCRLLSNPGYIEPLRQEADSVIAEEGWTKAGMDKLHKLDSFLRETQRIDSLGIGLSDSLHNNLSLIYNFQLEALMNRIALHPFTFSNGVTIPAGTRVAAPSSAIHMDEEIYPNPERFDGFRFLKPSESERGVAEARYQAVSMSSEYMPFGFGPHVW